MACVSVVGCKMLAIEPVYVFLRMANLPSAESGHLGAFVEAFLELAVTRGKNIDIWAQIRPRAFAFPTAASCQPSLTG